MFGKIMSISDELMWRYYELLTDLTVADIYSIRMSVKAGEENPRDLKVNLAKRIITDFHSYEDAVAAEEKFNRVFRRKEVPDEVEERDYPVGPQGQRIYILLVDVGLASSFAEARRLIQQGGVRIHHDKGTHIVQDSTETIVKTPKSDSVLIQVGKRRFMRVRLVDKLDGA